MNSADSKIKILIIGEEHIRKKVSRHYLSLEENGPFDTYFFVDDRSGITRNNDDLRYLRIKFARRAPTGIFGLIMYWITLLSFFFRIRPHLIEVYSAIHSLALLPFAWFACLKGVPITMVCRGEIHPTQYYQRGLLYRICFQRLLKLSRLIIVKETYMDPILDKLAPKVPRIRWHNSIPLTAVHSFDRDEDVVLFLNRFEKTRNLELIVHSAQIVKQKFNSVQFLLVGATTHLSEKSGIYKAQVRYEAALLSLIQSMKLDKTVRVLPFTDMPSNFYDLAKIYLLPADHVFCNYSLLEAMERGVPPIVCDELDPAARLIVQHEKNGLIARRDAQDLAQAVCRLLGDEEFRKDLGKEARKTVEEDFNLHRSINVLSTAYKELIYAGRKKVCQF